MEFERSIIHFRFFEARCEKNNALNQWVKRYPTSKKGQDNIVLAYILNISFLTYLTTTNFLLSVIPSIFLTKTLYTPFSKA